MDSFTEIRMCHIYTDANIYANDLTEARRQATSISLFLFYSCPIFVIYLLGNDALGENFLDLFEIYYWMKF